MKNLKPLRWLSLTLLLFLSACSVKAEAPTKPLTLMVASDLHYLAPELTDMGPNFMTMIQDGDGKATHESGAILDAFIATVLKKHPDALILSGDLTFNGEKLSHEQLSSKLEILDDAGIQVLALPGNHDLHTTPHRFTDNTYEDIEGIDGATFATLYAQSGYGKALSRDTASLSYTFALSPSVRILLVDVNDSGLQGSVNEKTLVWIKDQLAQAKRTGAKVIAVSHQNLLIHQSRIGFGYQINNADKLLELFHTYDVSLNLSGHLHFQHIAEDNGVTDIASSSLSIYPNQYGVLDIGLDLSLDYHTESLDVSAWAKANGTSGFEHFREASMALFDQTTLSHITDRLSESVKDETVRNQLIEYALKVNRAFFSGNLSEDPDPSGSELWHQVLPDDRFTKNLDVILNREIPDMSVWSDKS